MKSHEILVLLLRLRQVCGHCGLIASMLDPDDTPVDEDLGGQDLLAELNKLTLNDQRSRRKVGVIYNVTTEIVVKFGGEVRSMFY